MDHKAKVHKEVKDAVLRARKHVEELTKTAKLEAAKEAIEELGQYLASLSEEAPERKTETTEDNEDPRKVEFETRKAHMAKDVQRALKERIGDVSRIRAAAALADERAEGRDYASALKVLDGLNELLKKGETEEDELPIPGLVEYRKKLLAFEDARSRVDSQMEQLVAAIPKTLPEETDLADALAEEIEEELDEVQALIDEAINTANNDRSPVEADLKDQIRKALQVLQSSKLVEHVENNKFEVSVQIRKILGDALEGILAAIPVTA
jgi:hypothetical protein